MTNFLIFPSLDEDYNFPPEVRQKLFESEEFAAVTKAHVGLDQVDNTADLLKPVSGPQQDALDLKVSKGEMVFNVKDYGAVGDGLTDDFLAIEEAVNAANANGGTVFFPLPSVSYFVGGYRTFSTPGPSQFGRYAFRVRSNVTITGAAGAVISENIDYNNRRVMFYLEGSNIQFNFLIFRNDYPMAGGSRPTSIPIGAGDGFDLGFAAVMRDIKIRACQFIRSWHPTKFNFNGAPGTARLENVSIEGCVARAEVLSTSSGGYNFQSIPAGRITNITVTHSQCYDVTVSAAIGYYGVVGGVISSNITAGSQIDGAGIQLENGSKDISIVANRGLNHFNHIWLDDSSHCTVMGNTAVNDTPGANYKGVRITKQGYAEVPDKEVTKIQVIGNINTNCYIAQEAFSAPLGSPTFGRMAYSSNYVYLDGVTNNRGFNLEGCKVLQMFMNHVEGAAQDSIRTTPIVNQRSFFVGNVTEKVGTESSVGLFIANANGFRPQTVGNDFTNGISSPQALSTMIGNVRIFAGVGSPEGAVAGPIGSEYFREDGGPNTARYLKESGTGATGWVAK